MQVTKSVEVSLLLNPANSMQFCMEPTVKDVYVSVFLQDEERGVGGA